MKRVVLRDDQWDRIKDLLPGKVGDCGVTAADIAYLSKRCYGLPEQAHPGEICLNALVTGIESICAITVGHIKASGQIILTATSDDPDLEYLRVDGSIVRVHQHGAAKKTAAGAGHGEIARRLEHEDSCRG